MATEPATTDQAFQGPAAFEEEARREGVHGVGPWKLGLRRLRRNKVALFFGFLFVLLVAGCLAAPLWSEHVAHTGPSDNHLTDTIVVDGERTDVVALDGTPIGPTWQGEFFLGADKNGRDVMVRLLYGGRNSLVVGVTAALMTTVLSIILGLLAGFLRGKVDVGIRGLLDVMWSFPAIILGVALGVALALGGLAAAHHVRRGAAEPRVNPPGLLHAPDRQRDPARGVAVIPGRRDTAAKSLLGHDDRRGRRADCDRTPPDHRAGHHARGHSALSERVRRRRQGRS